MKLFNSIWKWWKSLVLWVLISENRTVGLKYTKKALEIAEIVAEKTYTNKDDKAIIFLAKQFDKAVKINNITDSQEIKNITEAVSRITEGDLEDVKINADKDGIKLEVGKLGVKYDPKDGSVKFKRTKLY